MVARSRPAVTAGLMGALILFLSIFIFGFSWFMLPREQICLSSWIYMPGSIFAFILSGALSSYFAPQEDAGLAFKRGIIAGCITALVPLALYVLVVALLLVFQRPFWYDIFFMVVPLVVVIICLAGGVFISAFSSMFYVFLTRHVTITVK
jgi:hypothetical protein